jgi:hypothetical protein
MKKDIDFIPVQNVQLAVVKAKDESDTVLWKVHILNKNKVAIANVLIASKGYGEKNGEKQSTSTLRHYIENIGPEESAVIEPIDHNLFHLFNEYWVSYYIDDQIYDKKFIFVPGSIREQNMTYIDMIQNDGVLHA